MAYLIKVFCNKKDCEFLTKGKCTRQTLRINGLKCISYIKAVLDNIEIKNIEYEKSITIARLESILADFLNNKITEAEMKNQFKNYCDIRDM